MLKCKLKIYKNRILSLVLLIVVSLACLASCQRSIDCYSLAKTFLEDFGMAGVIYSPKIPEGEVGYVAEDFYILMYSEEDIHSEDFAILLSSRGDCPEEAAFFLALSEWDAISIEQMLKSRIDLIGSLLGRVGDSPANGAFVIRKGRLVAMCATRDNERAKRVIGYQL